MEEELDISSENAYFPQYRTLGASLYTPAEPTSEKSIAVIVHGHAGHRDYCYQKLLSRSLTIPSIRFDFSGCGKQLGQGTPKGRETEEIPRLMESDRLDLQTVIAFVRRRGYFVTALIGHSRGAVACLQYAKRDATIPTVVNCSGRYRAHLIHEKVKRNPNLKPGVLGYWEVHRAGTGGALVDKWTLLSEIDSVGDQEMLGIGRELPSTTNVLIVFGSKDNIVPVADAGMFVNELRERAELHLVEDADHNFFVHPTDGSKKVNKNQQVADIVARYLSPEATRLRFLRRAETIKIPRFIDCEGLNNFRDLGGFLNFPRGLVYRSADLSTLSPAGLRVLEEHVAVILDIRSDPEVASNGTVGPADAPLTLTTTRRRHVPIFRTIDYSPTGLAKFFGDRVATPRERETGMVKAYKSILHNALPVFPILFDTMLNLKTGRGVLLHCSAGKDRTGILAAVLLLLAGVDAETVALEYELTTAGLDRRHRLHSSLLPSSSSSSSSSPSSSSPSSSSSSSPSNSSSKDGEEGVGQGSHAEIMRRAIRMLDSEFGGVHQYLGAIVPPAQLQAVQDLLTGRTRIEKSKI